MAMQRKDRYGGNFRTGACRKTIDAFIVRIIGHNESELLHSSPIALRNPHKIGSVGLAHIGSLKLGWVVSLVKIPGIEARFRRREIRSRRDRC